MVCHCFSFWDLKKLVVRFSLKNKIKKRLKWLSCSCHQDDVTQKPLKLKAVLKERVLEQNASQRKGQDLGRAA